MQDTLSLEQLREACELLEGALRRDGIPDAQLAALRPGGADNPDASIHGWLRCFGQLHRLHAGGGGPAGRAATREGLAETALQAVLAEEPVTVPLTTVPDGAPAAVQVYPKSYVALRECALLDERLQLATAARRTLDGRIGADMEQARETVDAAWSYAYALLVWIVTHPGPGLPYEEFAVEPLPPAWIAALSPIDLLRIAFAHQEVNVHRLAALERLTSTEAAPGRPRRPSWATFFAARADGAGDLHRLTRATSMAREIAAAALAAEAHRQARADASAA